MNIAQYKECTICAIKRGDRRNLLLTLAANAVVEKRTRPDYRLNEKAWMGGNFRKIVESRMRDIHQRLNI